MRTVIYATDPQRFGRTEWRLEVWESSDETRWRLPAEHAGDWPKSLFKLAVENVIKLADALRG